MGVLHGPAHHLTAWVSECVVVRREREKWNGARTVERGRTGDPAAPGSRLMGVADTAI